jgi:ribosomal protein S18 acetylase RimI-like enzyme
LPPTQSCRIRPSIRWTRSSALLDEVSAAGVGAQLLDFTDRHARERGLSEVRLYTNEAMTENIDYYRHGLVETHRATDHGYQRGFVTKYL